MTLLPIRTLGDPVLRTPAEPVTVFDDALRRLVDNMIETMYDAPGVGLAAPQIGVGLRVFVFDTEYDSDDPRSSREPLVVVNPELETGAVGQDGSEGCLSVPGLAYPTPRSATATVRGFDATGAAVSYTGSGLLARCLQHETDHLNGTLYLDRLTDEHRQAAQKALSGGVRASRPVPSIFRRRSGDG
ncbi:peptide deformylase [Parafrankia irregularis]|uniref:Peptide deformylase n=1 Tax=Parafrankia irregularis TaxID=795642 RepID=A0A0S4QMT3_9ACTN|nr:MULTISPECIES: peptide deformylase [Parafrankia]MBE3200498.1 peptide deformylase [Parafrankia sp. CH37]CUU56829.1 peptide deformylase [Parafrankia irregularis]